MVTAEELEKFTEHVSKREKIAQRFLKVLVACVGLLLGLIIVKQLNPSFRVGVELLSALQTFQIFLFLTLIASYVWQVLLFRDYAKLSVLRYAISGDDKLFPDNDSELTSRILGKIPTITDYIPWALEFDRLSMHPPRIVQEKFDRLDNQQGNLIWAAFRERQSKHAN
jgi:hypothetical protein